MKTTIFNINENFLNVGTKTCLYENNETGDQSGVYVRAETAKELLNALEEIFESGSIQQAEIISHKMLVKYGVIKTDEN